MSIQMMPLYPFLPYLKHKVSFNKIHKSLWILKQEVLALIMISAYQSEI